MLSTVVTEVSTAKWPLIKKYQRLRQVDESDWFIRRGESVVIGRGVDSLWDIKANHENLDSKATV